MRKYLGESMVQNPSQILKGIKATKDYFVGIDSDGCAFDTMEIKHKECFCPNTVLFWELQVISKFVREAWDFVNLYSNTRGYNRFKALLRVIELLSERKEVINRNTELPNLNPLLKWTQKETKLGNPALEKYAVETDDPIIITALKWSIEINNDVERMVHGISPFPFMKESLEKLGEHADAMVISQTPVEALNREWEENSMSKYVSFIAGQEFGTKTEHLMYGAKGKYEDDKILMIGDAPGDMIAAKTNGVLFYPINHGHEEESWNRFYNESLRKFFEGNYNGEYEDKLISEFNQFLPATPPWEVNN